MYIDLINILWKKWKKTQENIKQTEEEQKNRNIKTIVTWASFFDAGM